MIDHDLRAVLVTTCPACEQRIRLTTDEVTIDEDSGLPVVGTEEADRALLLHLRHGCVAVCRCEPEGASR